MKLTIIIVTYLNIELVMNCLKSITQFNDIDGELELIIVDNSPTDELRKYISDYDNKIIYVKSDNNGFGTSVNLGVKHAKGEYLLILNPDTIIVEPIFGFAVNKFEEDNSIDAFGVRLIDKQHNKNMSYFWLIDNGFISNLLIKLFNRFNLFLSNKMFLSGADIFIRKSSFIKIRGFDENIFMYNEDRDLFYRLNENKFKYIFVKEKTIIHLEGSGQKNESFNSFENRIKSYLYFLTKHDIDVNKKIKKIKNLYRVKIKFYKLMNMDSQKEYYLNKFEIFKEIVDKR